MRKRMIVLQLVTAAVLGLAAATGALGQQMNAAADEKGIASRYPGDRGIEKHPSVVFVEDFETGGTGELKQRWDAMINPNGKVLSLVSDSVPGGRSGRSIMITATKGHDTGGDLWKLLDKGYDRLYARFYVKFAPDAPYVHHFVSMGGKVDTLRYPVGRAGTRPDGFDRFGSSIDLIRTNADPPGKWAFYTYWSEMRSWQTPQGESDGRPSPFYGNLFGPVEPLQAKRGEWQCVEMMIKLNSAPDKRDGEQAFWVDGKLAAHWAPGSHMGRWVGAGFRVHGAPQYQGSASRDSIPQPFEGFLWRKTDELKINVFRLQYYLAHIFEQNVKPDNPNIPYNGDKGWVRFDNVVLATEYIGPVRGE